MLLTANARIVRDANAAEIVERNGGNLTGTPRAVLIVAIVLRHRIRVVTIDIVRGGRILQFLWVAVDVQER